MSAAAPNPDRMILLAVLGVGTYLFLKSRRAVAATPTAPGTPVANPYTGTLAQLAGNLVGKLLGSNYGTVDGRSATAWSPATTGANNPSAYSASSAVDGAAFNPPGNVSPYDSAVDMGTATGDDLSAFF